MNNKKLHIKKGDEISKEILLAYLRGQLSASDTQRIDQLVAQDDFLKDAVEGLKITAGITLDKRLQIINEKVDAFTGTKKTFTLSPVLRKYAAAASLLIFFSITIIIMRVLNAPQKNNTIASEDLNKIAQEKSISIVTDSGMGSGSVDSDSLPIIQNSFNGAASTTESSASGRIEPISELKTDYRIVSEENTVTATAGASPVVSSEYVTAELADAEVFSNASKTSNEEITARSEIATIDPKADEDKSISSSKDNHDRKNKKSKSEEDSAPTIAQADALNETVDQTDDLVFAFVEEMPSFIGGPDSLNAFIARNVQYQNLPEDVSGNVYVKFIVNTDGSISNAFVVRGLSKAFDDESLRLVNTMPLWNAGKQSGNAVRVWYTMSIKFPNIR